MIRVGGATEVEVKEKKDRVDDALHATRAAVEEGVVAGRRRRAAARRAGARELAADNADQQAGIEIVRRAVSAGPADRRERRRGRLDRRRQAA